MSNSLSENIQNLLCRVDRNFSKSNEAHGQLPDTRTTGPSSDTSQKLTFKFLLFFSLTCFFVGVIFSLSIGAFSWKIGLLGGLIGLTLGLGVLGIELVIERYPLGVIVHVAQSLGIGMIIALIVAGMIHFILPTSSHLAPAISLASMLAFPYLSLTLKKRTLQMLEQPHSKEWPSPSSQGAKVLDTSSIIDGRIFDLCETGFLEGPVLIPRFVLGELHSIADSPHSWKRIRGKRGLEILADLQLIQGIQAQIIDHDFPDIPEVDHKLLKLAKQRDAKIVTNDWNLAKVASLQGLPTLNINQLFYQLKPPVLPGEVIRVFINKEGDLAGQGVAHLDDGTMLVVDQASDYVKETIDVIITKFMQTQSGRILFGSRLVRSATHTDP